MLYDVSYIVYCVLYVVCFCVGVVCLTCYLSLCDGCYLSCVVAMCIYRVLWRSSFGPRCKLCDVLWCVVTCVLMYMCVMCAL